MSGAMTSRTFRLTVRCPRGTVLVGGYSSVPEELDAVHARRLDGKAILPASALRGALREGLEAVLRGAGRAACAGGSGVDPASVAFGQPSEARPCDLDEGKPCLACRLFGGERRTIGAGERAFSALVLEDAVDVAAGDEGTTMGVRHGVTIDRRRRSASDKLLFNRETPIAGHGESAPTFVAEGRLLDPSLQAYLEAAIEVTKHIGSGRSRGLGRIEIDLGWLAAAPAAAPAVTTEGVDLVVTLETAGCVGAPFAWSNLRTTRREVPGSSLRGAVGFALAEVLSDLDDTAFQTLVDPETGAIFDFAWPALPRSAPKVPGPWPLTARACKRAPSDHATDVLVDRLLLALAGDDVEAALRVATRLEQDPLRESCPKCGGALKARRGWRGDAPAPATPVPTRLALDRRTRSARDGALFSTEMLEQGTTFTASIRRVPAGTEARLAEALTRPLSLGAGRHRGWGRIQVAVAPRQEQNDLDIRARRFEKALKEAAQKVSVAIDAGRFVPVTLIAPLLPDAADDDGAASLASALGLDVSACVLRVRRFGEENGWDQLHGGRRTMRRSTVAGSVFVFDLGEGRDVRAVTDAIRELERNGAGARRTQGFGRVITFDPALVEPARAGAK